MTRFSSRAIALALLAAMGGTIALSAASAETVQREDRFAFILLHEGSNSSSMNGSMDDLRHAQGLRSGREALLYVRHAGSAYIIRDHAVLRQAQELFKPQEELGARQAALGTRQAALGERQAALGAKQAHLGMLQAEAPPRRQGELGRQQGELGRQQGELGRQQGELGRQQGELGREQARLGQIANARMRELVADAIRSGAAQRVN